MKRLLLQPRMYPGAVYTWTMLPGLALGETGSTYVIDSLKASNAGKYTVSYTLNGCASSVDTVDVQFVAPPFRITICTISLPVSMIPFSMYC
jgi:hypothetical protein